MGQHLIVWAALSGEHLVQHGPEWLVWLYIFVVGGFEILMFGSAFMHLYREKNKS